MTNNQILTVACPKCQVKPGVSCISHRRKIQTITRPHHQRRRAFLATFAHCRLCGNSSWTIGKDRKGEPIHLCVTCNIPMP